MRDIRWALEHDLGDVDLLPMLQSLLRRAAPASDESLFAKQTLAELIVEYEPWRAARLAHEVLVVVEAHGSVPTRAVSADRAWAIVGLSQTLLGNFRSAARAYRHAVALAPGCASYAHNLGHLLDVALHRPRAAVIHLQHAVRLAPDEEEIAASLAHALLGCGQRQRAVELLRAKLSLSQQRAEALAESWRRPTDGDDR